MSLEKCRIIELPHITEPRGKLIFIEAESHIPFAIKRVFYLYDVPGGATRAGHGHKRLEQFMIAISGSFDVLLDDGREKKRYHLNHPFYGLYIPPLVWRGLENFSSGSVCMVLASRAYSEADYFRDYDEFVRAARAL